MIIFVNGYMNCSAPTSQNDALVIASLFCSTIALLRFDRESNL
jgi:hypothetical protein